MAGEDWPSWSKRELDAGKVQSLADRLRKRRRVPPPDPDDGLSPLDRLLKALYPHLFTDPAWSDPHDE